MDCVLGSCILTPNTYGCYLLRILYGCSVLSGIILVIAASKYVQIYSLLRVCVESKVRKVIIFKYLKYSNITPANFGIFFFHFVQCVPNDFTYRLFWQIYLFFNDLNLNHIV